MKVYYKLLILFFLTINGFFGWSQTWPKYYSQVNMYDNPEDLLETYDKGYMICGNFGNNYGQTVKQWSWLIKTDINGNILWEKIINAQEEYVATYAIDQTMDGGMLACGLIFSWNVGLYYPYVMKLNACGEKDWCKVFTGTVSLSTWAQDIKELPSGEITVLVNGWEGWEENSAIHLFRLNAQGEVLWTRGFCKKSDYPVSGTPIGNSMLLSENENLIITGSVYWENPWGPTGLVYIRSCFIMTDQYGMEKWVLPFGLNDTIYGKAFRSVSINDGTFIGLGTIWSGSFSIDPISFSFDQNGNELNFNKFPSGQIDTSFIRCYLSDYFKINNNVFISGAVATTTSPEYYFPVVQLIGDTNLFKPDYYFHTVKVLKNSYDPQISNLSADLKLLNSSTFKQSDNTDIIFTRLNLNLDYDTAYNGNFIYDSLCTSGPPQSGIINLADCDIVVGIDTPTPEQYYESLKTIPIRAYPNPAGDRITFELENTRHHPNLQLICYDIFGKMLHSEIMITGQTGVSFDVSLWAPGVYITVIYSNGSPAGKCKFMVKNR